jgi:hypothetical protein
MSNAGRAFAPRPGLLLQVVDQHLGVHFLLDVQRRRVHHQVGPVLRVLAAPHQLRVEVGIALRLLGVQRVGVGRAARAAHPHQLLRLVGHQALVLGGGNVSALVVGVLQHVHANEVCRGLLGRHAFVPEIFNRDVSQQKPRRRTARGTGCAAYTESERFFKSSRTTK